MTALAFVVLAQPVGQGRISGGGTHTDATGRTTRRSAYHSNGAKLRRWRKSVVSAATLAMARDGWTTATRPAAIELSVTFWMPRPPTIKPARRPLPTLGGKDTADTSHLVRALEDALTEAKVWDDDSQVTDYGRIAKRYADHHLPGAAVTVRLLTDDEIAATLTPAEEHTA